MVDLKYGGIILARSEVLLPRLPAVRAAFGTRWDELLDHGDGWQQLAVLLPYGHQVRRVSGGPRELAAATGSPVLVGWISESSCLYLVGAHPDGRSFRAHVPDYGDGCGLDHHQFALLRLPTGEYPAPLNLAALTDDLLDWAAAAGLDPVPAGIGPAFGRHHLRRNIDALVTALGLPDGREVPPLVWHFDADLHHAWHKGWRAANRVAECQSRLAEFPEDLNDYDLRPGDVEFIAFVDRCADSSYPNGPATRDELVAEARRLMSTYYPGES